MLTSDLNAFRNPMQVTQLNLSARSETNKPPANINGKSMVDVVVIGAGISGLIAARDLEKQYRSTTFLEG
jgi:monoamine oxidase